MSERVRLTPEQVAQFVRDHEEARAAYDTTRVGGIAEAAFPLLVDEIEGLREERDTARRALGQLHPRLRQVECDLDDARWRLQCATAFEVMPRTPRGGDMTVERAGRRWIVRQMGLWTLTKDGGWTQEPLPSYRTEAFEAQTRWDTLEEAWAAAEAAAAREREEER